MRVAEFIANLAKAPGRGAHLRALDGNRIEFNGDKSLLSDEVRRHIEENRDAICAWLRTPIDEQPVDDQLLLDYAPQSNDEALRW